MDRLLPGLAAHKGLRGDILIELKKAQPLTASQLGEAFGVSANAVRRHLKELEVEGLVGYARDQRGTAGAPTYEYRLSDAGEALFPNQNEDVLTRLLTHVMEHEGRGAAASVLEGKYSDMRRMVAADFAELTPADRVKEVARVMEEAGFMAEYEESDGETRLMLHNCVMRVAATCLPEVCDAELSFLRDLVERPLERRAHIMNGCNACEYVIKDGNRPSAA